MIEKEMLDFVEYLKNAEKRIDEELIPYYERIAKREKARMNSYGVATPKDNVLLNESTAIYDLRQKASSNISFRELEKEIKDEIYNCQDKEVILKLKRQLSYVNEYLKMKQGQKLFDNSEDTYGEISVESHKKK